MRTVLHLRALLFALALGLAGPQAFAQATPADDTLYQALGGQRGVALLMDDFMLRLLADPRTRPFFKDVNQAHVKAQLVDQVCQLAGGPCELKGPPMKQVHEHLAIDRAAFNALVEVLQRSMDDQGIPFSAQNRLLARLAPMHRDIVNTP
ncbi:group I truncated hemoglobin [Ideonella sp. BN130291]|uniref:group I truncated hemoglobin n=1 Tax=Ideonella sp. BN130291 TaxID=3112940 RepID=UPI002E26A95B|nr:group 1 truncated hemoglobin [Ideonella sp. BN130291]